MKHTPSLILTSLLAFSLLAVTGCRSGRQAVSSTVVLNRSDSARTVHAERVDTVTATLPAASAATTSATGSSVLATDFAESTAHINTDGSLTHSIRHLPAPVKVAIKATVDSVIVERTVEVPVEVPVAVERQFTHWERLRLDSWWWIAAALAGIALFLLRRLLRVA